LLEQWIPKHKEQNFYVAYNFSARKKKSECAESDIRRTSLSWFKTTACS
jgi:hypothetical protein